MAERYPPRKSPKWDERMEKNRNKYLKEDYQEHAPKARSFKTPSRKGEEISNYAIIMRLKKQENKNASDKKLHDLAVRELVKQAPTSSKESVANFWDKKGFDKKRVNEIFKKEQQGAKPKASGGAVNKNYAYGGRVAKMSAEKS